MPTVILISISILMTVVGNLLLKEGARLTANSGATLIEAILNWRVVSGLACFGIALVAYLLVLQRLPLNVAQSIYSAQFIGVILGAAIVLGEPIGLARGVGILLIATGIAVVGWTTGTGG